MSLNPCGSLWRSAQRSCCPPWSANASLPRSHATLANFYRLKTVCTCIAFINPYHRHLLSILPIPRPCLHYPLHKFSSPGISNVAFTDIQLALRSSFLSVIEAVANEQFLLVQYVSPSLNRKRLVCSRQHLGFHLVDSAIIIMANVSSR